MMHVIAGLAGVGLVGALGFAIYAIVVQRENGRLFRDNVNLKVEAKTEEGRRKLIEAKLVAYEELVEQLEAEENICAVDPATAERLPPGYIRDLIERRMRENADGIRSGVIDTGTPIVDPDADVGIIRGDLR
jgi:hypothetical protein